MPPLQLWSEVWGKHVRILGLVLEGNTDTPVYPPLLIPDHQEANGFLTWSHPHTLCGPRPNRIKQELWAKVNISSMHANYSNYLLQWQEANKRIVEKERGEIINLQKKKKKKRKKNWKRPGKPKCKQEEAEELPEKSALGRVWKSLWCVQHLHCFSHIVREKFSYTSSSIYLRKGWYRAHGIWP